MATFVLLHGAWHDAGCWRELQAQLESLGHRTLAPELPLHDPSATYADRTRPAIDRLAGIDGELIIVAHSQSSALGTLVAAEHPVDRLVYLCPRMGGIELPPGAPPPFREGFPFPPSLPDGTSVWDPAAAIEAMYPRLEPEAARKLAEHLRPMAMPPDDFPLREHPEVETTLIYAAEDEFFEPDFERFVARELLGVDPIEISGGHFPMTEDPEALAELLDGLASSGRA